MSRDGHYKLMAAEASQTGVRDVMGGLSPKHCLVLEDPPVELLQIVLECGMKEAFLEPLGWTRFNPPMEESPP